MTPAHRTSTKAKPTTERRCGSIALVGAPNVGKSTLLNALIGEKIAIVSRKPQTTRNRLMGVCTTASGNQLIVWDTPGVHPTDHPFNRFMVREAINAVGDVDVIVVVVEATAAPIRDADDFVYKRIAPLLEQRPCVVAINKIDRVGDRQQILPQIAAWSALGVRDIVPISARTGDGIAQLISAIEPQLPIGDPIYPDDMLTDRAERDLAAEIIREQVLQFCHQEVPHATAIEIQSFEERAETKDVVITAEICVERPSQKAIVIGAKGSMITRIGRNAREEIGKLLGYPVHLRLTVKVAKEWRDRPVERRRFGYQ